MLSIFLELTTIYSPSTMFWQGIVIAVGVIFAICAIVWNAKSKKENKTGN